jgi:hypothetical protein
MSNVLLNTSILTIYGLWKSSEIFIVDKSLAVRIGWQITRRLSDLVFVMSNGAIFNKDKNTTVRFSVRNCTYTNEKLYLRMSNVLLNNLQQYYSDLWPLFWKPSEIVNCIICWQIAQIIKNAVRLILDNFGIVGFLFFGRIPVDSSHFSLHFDNILSPKATTYSRLDVLNWRPTEECSVL